MTSHEQYSLDREAAALLRNGYELLQQRDTDGGRDRLERTRQSTDIASLHIQQLEAGVQVLDSSVQLLTCSRDLVLSIMQLHAEVARIGIQAEASVAKLRAAAPVVQRSLEQLSDRIDSLIERALAIDATDSSHSQLELRNQLIDLATVSSSQSQSLLFKFLSM